jgi:hypothetical protein
MYSRLQARGVTRETNIGLCHTQLKFGDSIINLGFHVVGVQVHPKIFNCKNMPDIMKRSVYDSNNNNKWRYSIM